MFGKTLSLLVILSGIAFLASGQTFTYGFENGNYNDDWSGDTGTYERSTDEAYSGSYSLKYPNTEYTNYQVKNTTANCVSPSSLQTSMYKRSGNYDGTVASDDDQFTDFQDSNSNDVIRVHFNDQIDVNGVSIKSNPSAETWYNVKLKDISWESETVGNIELNGVDVASNVAFDNSANCFSQTVLRNAMPTYGSPVYWDDVSTPYTTNSPPSVNSVSTSPSIWSNNGSRIDLEVQVSDPDANVESLNASVTEGTEKVKEDIALTNESGVWKKRNLFSVKEPNVYYNLTVEAIDTEGAVSSYDVNKFAGNSSLTWSGSGDAEGYRIYSNTSSNSMTEIADVASLSYEHISTALSSGNYVCYEVTAYNEYGESDPTPEKCTTVP